MLSFKNMTYEVSFLITTNVAGLNYLLCFLYYLDVYIYLYYGSSLFLEDFIMNKIFYFSCFFNWHSYVNTFITYYIFIHTECTLST